MDPRSRGLAFEKGMESVATRYPEDDEAQILYALVLITTAVPTDKTFAHQLKAAGILEPLFKKYPNHPGIAHYLIHTYDYTGLAEKGLPAARAYYTKLQALTADRDTERPELAQAAAFLAKQ